VVEAIADGEKAAVGINRYLTGEERVSWRVSKTVDTYFDPDADPVLARRPELKLIPVAKRKGFAEVETTWAASVALAETKRCLRCDYRDQPETATR
jgi:NADH-quinone oxidoreductase subunit F